MKDLKKLQKKDCQKKEEPGVFCCIRDGGFDGSITILVVVVIAAVTGDRRRSRRRRSSGIYTFSDNTMQDVVNIPQL